MIEAKNIKKTYKDGTQAVKGMSFVLDKKVTSIIGHNGAGKTTLIRMLSTQLLPTSGTASINGHDIIKDVMAVRKTTVSIPQEINPIGWITVFDNLRLYLHARGLPIKESKLRAEKAMKEIGIWDIRNKHAADISGGQKRKIFVGMAIASGADTIFLDEPTTGLDPFSRIQVWSAIRKAKGQVVLTTHYMEEAQSLSDDVLMVDKGKILSKGSVRQLLKPLEKMVRVESMKKRSNSIPVGNTWVSYVKREEAESFVMEGDIIKPITLDDIFIKKGVNLES